MSGPARSLAEETFDLEPRCFPFESHFRDIRGARLHYVDEGSGPVLVMLHGNPTWSFLFRHMILALRARYRCIALDLPGFGLSTPAPGFSYLPEDHAAIVAGLLAELGVQDATLVAHDWGVPIGLAAGFAEPGRLTRFALGNGWAWPVNGEWQFEWFSLVMGGAFGRFAARRWNLFLNGVMFATMRRAPLGEATRQAYRAALRDPARRTGTHVFPAAITGSHEFLAGIEARLPELDGRGFLFLWPDRDLVFRARELRRWRAMFPGSRLVELHRCGHYLFEEAGPDCARAIDDWMKLELRASHWARAFEDQAPAI